MGLVNDGGVRAVNDKAARPTGSGDVLINVAGLAVVVALLAIGIAYAIDGLDRRTATSASPTPAVDMAANVAGVALKVPAPWLKDPDAPASAFSDRLDLSVAIDLGDKLVPMTLTLVSRTRARASAALVDSVYLQHFGPEELGGVPGLIGKPLTGGAGYDGETVWYDPIRLNPFAAKCAAPLGAETSGRCLRTLVLDSGLAAIVAFPDTALAAWRDFDVPLAALLERIGAGRPLG